MKVSCKVCGKQFDDFDAICPSCGKYHSQRDLHKKGTYARYHDLEREGDNLGLFHAVKESFKAADQLLTASLKPGADVENLAKNLISTLRQEVDNRKSAMSDETGRDAAQQRSSEQVSRARAKTTQANKQRSGASKMNWVHLIPFLFILLGVLTNLIVPVINDFVEGRFEPDYIVEDFLPGTDTVVGYDGEDSLLNYITEHIDEFSSVEVFDATMVALVTDMQYEASDYEYLAWQFEVDGYDYAAMRCYLQAGALTQDEWDSEYYFISADEIMSPLSALFRTETAKVLEDFYGVPMRELTWLDIGTSLSSVSYDADSNRLSITGTLPNGSVSQRDFTVWEEDISLWAFCGAEQEDGLTISAAG